MEELAIVNKRRLIYQRHALDVNWANAIPIRNWLLLVVVENKNKTVLDEISRKAIDNNVCYVCCTGEQAELLHDMFDDEIVFRDVDIEDHHLPNHVIITIWDKNFEEALWHSVFAANNDEEQIEFILCLDCSRLGIKDRLEKSISSY